MGPCKEFGARAKKKQEWISYTGKEGEHMPILSVPKKLHNFVYSMFQVTWTTFKFNRNQL